MTDISLDSPPAETIVELFNQLGSQGYAAEDLRLIHRAYALAAPLYTCYYRSSGRPLIAHAVGTASIVAALAAPPPLVAAMVIHGVYAHGDFGTRMRRVSEDKRDRIRQPVGQVAEALVYEYTPFRWTVRTIPEVAARVQTLGSRERQIVLMRLADQLDIYGSRDALYCCNLAQRRDVARTCGPAMVAMADALGHPTLAAALARAYRGFADRAPRAGLESPRWKDGVTVPRSYRIRPSVAVYQRVRTALWRWTGR